MTDVPISKDVFLEKLALATQYDWAFFFLFREEISAIKGKIDVAQMVADCDLTIRLVDDSYVYIYTKDQLFVDHLTDQFELLATEYADISELNIPY